MSAQPTYIYGAGGHGRVVLDILRSSGRFRISGFLDSNPSLSGTLVEGMPVLGGLREVPEIVRDNPGAQAIVAIGDNQARHEVGQALAMAGMKLINAVHATAFVSPSAVLGTNVTVCAGTIVCSYAAIRDGVILNTGSIVEHECVVEENAHLAPSVKLAGRVTIGRNAFVGIGATVIQNIRIGAYSTVGAGAVVLDDVRDGDTVVGIPARSIRSKGN